MADEYDIIVIGGGPTGEHCAGKLSAKGCSVVLVEQELIGGECSYWACIPSKTLLRPVSLLDEARRVPGVKEAVTGPIDAASALARRNYMVSDWNDEGQVRWLEGAKVALERGHARLTGERAVKVERKDGSQVEIVARTAVVIAVGTGASIPPIPGLADARPWTNREILESQSVPRRLAIIGGGFVGVEMAQAWKGLGTEEVTLLEGGPRLLGPVEPFAAEAVAASFAHRGIDVRTGVSVTEVRRDGGGDVTVTTGDGSTVVADEILVATGRRPRTADIGLEVVGLEPGKYIAVDDAMRATGVEGEWLYAIGDANGRALLTHMGKYQGRVVADVVTGGTLRDHSDANAVTSVVFTDPQVASVGLTEKQARDSGLEVRILRSDLDETPAASIWGEDLSGTCQLVVDVSREIVVGATFVGTPVGDLLHAATIAVVGEVPLSTLRHAVAAFPTLNEIWLELVEQYFAA